MNSNCCICSQIAGDKCNDLISLSLREKGYTRRIAFESEHFAVIPSLGPLQPGHSLLCPKRHVKSFALIDLCDEALSMKAQLAEILADLYRTPVHLFEHGSAKNSDRVICTVDHAHLHFVPAKVDLSRSFETIDGWVKFDGRWSDFSQLVGNSEYLYYESPNGVKYININPPDAGGFESQLMRKVFALALDDSSSWNWREHPMPHIAHRTYQDVFKAINNRHRRDY